jgi:transposase
MSEAVSDKLGTIWRVSDALWERMSKVLAVYDPPAKVGRPRINQRMAMNAMIYRMRTGCQWNYLPAEFGWGMNIHRTMRRWEHKGIFDILWALLLIECEELGDVDWQWQSADGCLGKARGVPRLETLDGQKRGPATPTRVSGPTLPTALRPGSRRACLSRRAAAHLRFASPGRTSPT